MIGGLQEIIKRAGIYPSSDGTLGLGSERLIKAVKGCSDLNANQLCISY